MNTFDILTKSAELQESGVPFALATVTVSQRPTSARVGAKAVITADGAIFGWVGGACSQPGVVRHALSAIESGEPVLLRLSPDERGTAERAGVVELAMTCHSGGTLEIFIEPFRPEPYLIATGESPISRALIELGNSLGFRTVAMGFEADNARESYASRRFDNLSQSRPAFVVVATMGVADELALLEAIELNPVYLAMIGSRRRFDEVARYLRSQGITDQQIERIHAPAGLDIQAETPAEIALSILAEIVPLRRGLQYTGPVETPVSGRSRTGIDPVCGMEVDLDTATFTLTVDGELIGFCCAGCLQRFQDEQAELAGTRQSG